MTPRVEVNGARIFGPGDRVRFIEAHDIEPLVMCAVVFGCEEIYYRVTWVDSGRRYEEQVSARELEAIP